MNEWRNTVVLNLVIVILSNAQMTTVAPPQKYSCRLVAMTVAGKMVCIPYYVKEAVVALPFILTMNDRDV